MKKKKILYAGDSPAGGPANYLLAILRTLPVEVTHVPPGQKLPLNKIKQSFDAYIFSDYSYDDLSASCEKFIVADLVRGAGLLMIGGWGSFSGPFGKWKGSKIEGYLPVQCLPKDDRRNYASGMLIRQEKRHALLKGVSFAESPVICGLNEVRVRPGAQMLLSAQLMQNRNGKVSLKSKKFPFLVISNTKDSRSAALSTDLAPHWCGGWVDWGNTHVKLPVCGDIAVEVGDAYIRFVQGLLIWLADLSSK